MVRAGGYDGGDVETLVRGTLGRLLFSGDERRTGECDLRGEQGRMLFGKLMLLRNNVLLMDEPTTTSTWNRSSRSHRAGEIPGTLIFVSHDREFRFIAGDAHHRHPPGSNPHRLPRQYENIWQPGLHEPAVRPCPFNLT